MAERFGRDVKQNAGCRGCPPACEKLSVPEGVRTVFHLATCSAARVPVRGRRSEKVDADMRASDERIPQEMNKR